MKGEHGEEEERQQQNKVVYMNMNVMTDDQILQLAKQICVYVILTERLLAMYRSITAMEDLTPSGINQLYDSPLTSTQKRAIYRKRWNPTPAQVQILDCIFNEGTRSPDKKKILEITNELMQHGEVTNLNVYNWFQNRRARLKQKDMVTSEEIKSEVRIDGDEFLPEKKKRSENIDLYENTDPRHFHSCETEFVDPKPHEAEMTVPSDDGSANDGYNVNDHTKMVPENISEAEREVAPIKKRWTGLQEELQKQHETKWKEQEVSSHNTRDESTSTYKAGDTSDEEQLATIKRGSHPLMGKMEDPGGWSPLQGKKLWHD